MVEVNHYITPQVAIFDLLGTMLKASHPSRKSILYARGHCLQAKPNDTQRLKTINGSVTDLASSRSIHLSKPCIKHLIKEKLDSVAMLEVAFLTLTYLSALNIPYALNSNLVTAHGRLESV